MDLAALAAAVRDPGAMIGRVAYSASAVNSRSCGLTFRLARQVGEGDGAVATQISEGEASHALSRHRTITIDFRVDPFRVVEERGVHRDLIGAFTDLLQADHVYLAATLGERNHALAIKSKMTDIFTRHQTSNIITDRRATTEAIGRGGVLDFLRYHNLSIAQAEQVSPYLPVYAEFSPMEGGY